MVALLIKNYPVYYINNLLIIIFKVIVIINYDFYPQRGAAKEIPFTAFLYCFVSVYPIIYGLPKLPSPDVIRILDFR